MKIYVVCKTLVNDYTYISQTLVYDHLRAKMKMALLNGIISKTVKIGILNLIGINEICT